MLQRGGLQRGAQAKLAALLQVDPSTISKDVKRLLPLVTICLHCGGWQPRSWLEDEDLTGG